MSVTAPAQPTPLSPLIANDGKGIWLRGEVAKVDSKIDAGMKGHLWWKKPDIHAGTGTFGSEGYAQRVGKSYQQAIDAASMISQKRDLTDSTIAVFQEPESKDFYVQPMRTVGGGLMTIDPSWGNTKPYPETLNAEALNPTLRALVGQSTKLEFPEGTTTASLERERRLLQLYI